MVKHDGTKLRLTPEQRDWALGRYRQFKNRRREEDLRLDKESLYLWIRVVGESLIKFREAILAAGTN